MMTALTLTSPSWIWSKDDLVAMRITKNFTLAELVYSPTALHAGIEQEDHLDTNAISRISVLAVSILQPVRDKFGPVRVNSCFRSKPLNDLLNGAEHSAHCCAEDKAAADIEIYSEDVSNLELAEWIRDNLEFDQLILENYKPERISKITGKPEGPNSGWVHVAFTAMGANRKEVLRMVKDPKSNKPKYYQGLTE